MRKNVSKTKLWLVIILLIGSIGFFVIVLAHSCSRGPVPSELMPEPILPSNPVEAEQIVRDRAFRDAFRGIDKETCKKRHEDRLKKLEKIKTVDKKGN